MLQSGCVPFWCLLELSNREGVATVVRGHPTWCCAPFHGVLLARLGEGVGDCRGAAVTPKVVLFGSLQVVLGGKRNHFMV